MSLAGSHKYLQKTLRGFGFFETILYLALFSLMATALLNFSWDVLDLGTKERSSRSVFSDARFASERINYFIRHSAGIDTGNSVFGSNSGKLVLNTLGDSGDTVTIDIQSGNLVLSETGRTDVVLNSPLTQVEGLEFHRYGTVEDGSEYVDFTLTLQSVNYEESVSSQQARTSVQGGAFIRNDNL